MASSENLHALMVTSPSSDASYDESDGEKTSSLATVISIPNSVPNVSIIPSLKTRNEIPKKDEASQPLLGKRSLTSCMADISRRLGRRKVLHNRLSIVSDIMCLFGLLGVILMILENELSFIDMYHKQKMVSFIIKTIISITTIILVGLTCYYNYLNLKLYAVNNYLANWRIGLTTKKVLLILLEAIICLIHPFPRYLPFIQNIKSINSIIPSPVPLTYIDTDVALGLPMFARFYLLCRFMMYHSHLVHNASSQSLGYLNQVSINFFFLIKTHLEQWPARSLFMFTIFLLFIGSWSLRACNYTSTAEHLSMLDSMWLFIVTFTTVIGDLTPSTYCGRCIAGMIGLFGILSTALLISVLAQKLALTRSEKYVHNFVLNIELAKQRRHQAANVIKCTLRVWYLKRKGRPTTSGQFIKAERKLFRSIHANQQLKQEQKDLIDNCIGFPELITLQREVNGKTKENTQKTIVVKSKIDQVEEKIADMNEKMMNIQNTLNLLLDKMSH